MDLSQLENVWRAIAGPCSEITVGDGVSLVSDSALEKRLEKLRHAFVGYPRVRSRLVVPQAPKPDSDARSGQWAESRRCLATVLEKLLATGADPAAIHVSLSHCGDRAVAVASAASGVAGVGVDIERGDRKLTEAAVSRVLTPDEAAAGITGLEAWVLKEASFKADPENIGRVIAGYRLSSRGGTYSARAEYSRLEFRLGLSRGPEHCIGLAASYRPGP